MPETTVGARRVHYLDTGGDGTPVLLVHAFPFGGSMWQPQIDAFGDDYRLLVPDLPGFGDSDAPQDRSEYSVDTWAEYLNGVLDDAGVDKAVYVGLSMGGYVAFAFLRKFPERVSALVLADTRAEEDPPEGKEKRTSQQDLVAREGTAGLIEALTGALLSDDTKSNHPDIVEQVRARMDQPAAGFIGALEALKNRPDSTEMLAGISVPTLIVVGANDNVTPPDFSRKMHEHIGGSQLVVIPGAGHLSNQEAPDRFNDALGSFLKGL